MASALSDALVKRPLFLVSLSSLGFSTQALFVKLLVQSGLQSFQTVFVRGCFQFIGVALVLTHLGTPLRSWLGENREEAGCLALRGIFGYVGIGFGFLAITTTTLANSQVAAQTTPVWTALFSRIFLGEPWECAELLTTVAAAAGVCLMIRPAFLFAGVDDDAWTAELRGSTQRAEHDGGNNRREDLGDESGEHEGPLNQTVVGVLYALIGSLGAAGAYVMIRIMGTRVKVPWPKLMLAQATAQVLLSVPAGFVAGQAWVPSPTPRQVAYLAACGGLGFFSQCCMTIGMQRSKAAASSLVRQTGLVYSFLFEAFLVPSEALTLSTCVGAAVISLATLGLAYAREKAALTEKIWERKRALGRDAGADAGSGGDKSKHKKAKKTQGLVTQSRTECEVGGGRQAVLGCQLDIDGDEEEEGEEDEEGELEFGEEFEDGLKKKKKKKKKKTQRQQEDDEKGNTTTTPTSSDSSGKNGDSHGGLDDDDDDDDDGSSSKNTSRNENGRELNKAEEAEKKAGEKSVPVELHEIGLRWNNFFDPSSATSSWTRLDNQWDDSDDGDDDDGGGVGEHGNGRGGNGAAGGSSRETAGGRVRGGVSGGFMQWASWGGNAKVESRSRRRRRRQQKQRRTRWLKHHSGSNGVAGGGGGGRKEYIDFMQDDPGDDSDSGDSEVSEAEVDEEEAARVRGFDYYFDYHGDELERGVGSSSITSRLGFGFHSGGGGGLSAVGLGVLPAGGVEDVLPEGLVEAAAGGKAMLRSASRSVKSKFKQSVARPLRRHYRGVFVRPKAARQNKGKGSGGGGTVSFPSSAMRSSSSQGSSSSSSSSGDAGGRRSGSSNIGSNTSLEATGQGAVADSSTAQPPRFFVQEQWAKNAVGQANVFGRGSSAYEEGTRGCQPPDIGCAIEFEDENDEEDYAGV